MTAPTYTANKTTALDQANNPPAGGRSHRARGGLVQSWPLGWHWPRSHLFTLFLTMFRAFFLCSEPTGTPKMEPLKLFHKVLQGHDGHRQGCTEEGDARPSCFSGSIMVTVCAKGPLWLLPPRWCRNALHLQQELGTIVKGSLRDAAPA